MNWNRGGFMTYCKTIFVFLFGLTFIGCSSQYEQKRTTQPETVKPKVIYGQDDRLDFYQVSSLDWQKRALSTVALIQKSKLSAVANGYKIFTSSYGKTQNLCQGEPFYEQVTAAFCSGFLITPDIIMTAGHCVRTDTDCVGVRFVFDFAYKAMGVNPDFVDSDAVYSCQSLIRSEINSGTNSDYALIRLDRPVVGRSALPIRQSGSIQNGDPLVVIGHPSGLATKIAAGSNVRSTTPDAYFVANLDTYGGNSGSAVFNEQTGLVEGILVRGEVDFKYKNGCYVSNVCTSSGCRGEDVTRVSEILAYVDPSELAPLPSAEEPAVGEEAN